MEEVWCTFTGGRNWVPKCTVVVGVVYHESTGRKVRIAVTFLVRGNFGMCIVIVIVMIIIVRMRMVRMKMRRMKMIRVPSSCFRRETKVFAVTI